MDNFDANLKYTEPKPFHFGLSHSNPSTLIQVFFLKSFVKIPKGPLALFKTKTISAELKHTCKKEKNEFTICDKNLVSIDGVYINSMPLTILGFLVNNLLWQYTVTSLPDLTSLSESSFTKVSYPE